MNTFQENIFNKWSLYLLEMSLLFLAVWPVHYYYEVSFLSYFLTAAAAVLLFQCLFLLHSSPYLHLLGLPLLVFLSYAFGYPLFVAMLLGLLLYWRNTALFRNYLLSAEKNALFAILIGAPGYLLVGENTLGWMLLIHVLLALLVKLVSVSNAAFTDAESRRSYLQSSFLAIAVCGILSLGLVYLYPYFLRMVNGALYLFVVIAGWAASPLFYLMERLEVDMTGGPEDESSVEFRTEDEETFPAFEQTGAPGSEYYPIISWVAGAAVLLFLLIYIIKKVRERRPPEKDAYELFPLQEQEKPEFKEKRNRRQEQALPVVRKLFLQLQQRLYKLDYVRAPAQPVSEWMEELPLDKKHMKTVDHMYQQVRYGNKEPRSEELRRYKEAVKLLKKEIQEKAKEK